MAHFEPDGFTDAAFDAIADHGFAERFGRGEADARAGKARFGHRRGKAESCEEGTRRAGPLVINLTEIA